MCQERIEQMQMKALALYTSYHSGSYIADSFTSLDFLAGSASCGQSTENALTENDLRLE